MTDSYTQSLVAVVEALSNNAWQYSNVANHLKWLAAQNETLRIDAAAKDERIKKLSTHQQEGRFALGVGTVFLPVLIFAWINTIGAGNTFENLPMIAKFTTMFYLVWLMLGTIACIIVGLMPWKNKAD